MVCGLVYLNLLGGQGELTVASGSDHLRQLFSTQMGLSFRDILALSGGYSLVSPNCAIRLSYHVMLCRFEGHCIAW